MNKLIFVVLLTCGVMIAGCCCDCSCGKAKPKRAKVTVEPGRVLMQTDFAKGMKGWTFSNFQNLLTTQIVNEAGIASFKIANNHADAKKARDTMFGLVSDMFPVQAGEEFAIVVEARGTFSMEASTQRGGISTGVLWYGADKKPLLIQDPLGKMVPSGYEFGFKSLGASYLKTVKCSRVPAGAAYAKVKIGGDAPDFPLGGGNLDFKRIAMRAREGANGAWDFGDLEPPEFALACMTPDPNPNAAIRFKVLDESALDMAKFSCKLDGVDVTEKVKSEKGRVKSEEEDATFFLYTPETPWGKDSLHLIALEAADDCGNVGRETLAFFCGARYTKNIVTLRDDDMVLIDGKPFFPIAPCSVRKGPPNGYDFDRAVTDLKAAGFNLLGTYEMYNVGGAKGRKNYEELLDACDRHGIWVMPEVADRDYTDNRAAHLREALLDGRRHPSVLAWGIGDDTASHRTGLEVKNDHNIIKAIDNARLTHQGDISTYEGRQVPFVGATDVLVSEIYPFRNETPEPDGLAKVGQYMQFAYADKRTAGNKPWSIWGLPQAFSGWNLWKRFPTQAEIRAQSYISIIYGAKGLVYYTYFSFSKGANGFGHKPEQFAAMAAVAKELNAIQNDLASRDAKVQPKVSILNGPEKDLCGNPSVTCLLKEGADGKGQLLMAANARSDKPVKVRIEGLGVLGGAKGERIEVLFENGRKVAIENGCIVDTFEPGAVHVYRIK